MAQNKMSEFEPRDPDWRQRVRDSFACQALMGHLGVVIADMEPGRVTLSLEFDSRLTQQNGFLHAGVATTLADTAAGYAAASLFPAGYDVLSTEFKINLLNPGRGERFTGQARVVKSGRTLTVVSADVFGHFPDETIHIATGLFSMIALEGKG